MCLFLSETFVAGGRSDCFNSSRTDCLCTERYSHVRPCLAESWQVAFFFFSQGQVLGLTYRRVRTTEHTHTHITHSPSEWLSSGQRSGYWVSFERLFRLLKFSHPLKQNCDQMITWSVKEREKAKRCKSPLEGRTERKIISHEDDPIDPIGWWSN